MSTIHHWLHDSIYTKPLSPGCTLCAEGSKLVVLITGLCPASCFYCPLSFKKGGRDVIYADEWQLDDEKDTNKLIQEATYIKAKGAGITGGDPLSVWKRTKDYIELLKNTFGESFHIHLYTSGLENSDKIVDLANTGLDEIRFHPMPHDWKDMDSSPITKGIIQALKTDIDVAIEIPVIPKKEEDIIQLIQWADKQNINWINLNELEFSERNEENLHKKGFSEKNDISSAVSESQQTAYTILDTSAETSLSIGIHYCSSSFKDGIQLRNRIKRRAESIATQIDIITEEGTLLKGFIHNKDNKVLQTLSTNLQSTYGLQESECILDNVQHTLQIPIDLLEEIAENLTKKGFTCYISEEYPTADKLEVERIPLPYQ